MSGLVTRTLRVSTNTLRVSARTLALAVLVGGALTGCGRPATEAECQLIIDRIMDVELKATGTTDPDALAKKKEELRPSFQNELKECVGRRITRGMLDCVKKASTADEINQCIR